MKKIFLTALVAVSIATSAFADGNTIVNANVAKSFSASFASASEVTWKTGAGFIKATFILNAEKMEAFYNSDGDLIATSKDIPVAQLPAKATEAFAKNYDGYSIKEAILFDGEDETAYFISAENNSETVILKVTNNGNLSVFKRTKK